MGLDIILASILTVDALIKIELTHSCDTLSYLNHALGFSLWLLARNARIEVNHN